LLAVEQQRLVAYQSLLVACSEMMAPSLVLTLISCCLSSLLTLDARLTLAPPAPVTTVRRPPSARQLDKSTPINATDLVAADEQPISNGQFSSVHRETE